MTELYKISTVWDRVFCMLIYLGQNEGHEELQHTRRILDFPRLRYTSKF